MEMCVPRRSKNFLLARILTGHYLQAKLPSSGKHSDQGVHVRKVSILSHSIIYLKIPAQQLLYKWTVELPLALNLPRCATCVQ